MSWNYRIVKRLDGYFAVHEVYYNSKGEAWSMTENAVDIGLFDTQQEIIEMLMLVNVAARKLPIFVEPEHGKWAKPDWDIKNSKPLKAVQAELKRKHFRKTQ